VPVAILARADQVIERRAFLATLAASAAQWPGRASAQTPPKRPLIGFLGSSTKALAARYYSGFPQGMRELGYVEGRDYAFEDRYADGDVTRLSLLAEVLVRLKPDLIVAGPTVAVLAAKQATANIPIVGVNLNDPVGMGLVASEARPGTNVTGILVLVEGLAGKQVEIALDLVPGANKIGVLVNVNNPSNLSQRREVEAAAAKIGVSMATVEARAADDIGSAFQLFVRERASIVVVLGDAMFLDARRRIAAFALASRLPTVHGFREHVEDGGLVSYGIDVRQNYRRAAYFVDRILKGEKPGDLPVEFPTKLGLVINLTTAKAIGLTVPPALLARADEVIE
jgi:putative tryptophan/tyrosine transport system substrate-binding protein